MKTSPEDRKAIDQLFKEHHYTDDLGVIKSKLAGYVAGVRQDERTATTKLAIDAAHEILVGNRGAFTLFQYVKDAIEAATTKQPTEVKEGDDG